MDVAARARLGAVQISVRVDPEDAARPVRRGRPIKLDDFAKGRLLGLMSYGLSFRQAGPPGPAD